ncbi:MAG: electron transfer flavoprotein subunit beta/FixA family protein [Bacteroidetes bacterium]|nr:electron transfer flavoprotein subunit beta/FixA family protein [Bacteroidota bacterium]MDA1121374.1 electron transfer flavoprotein subunit beta/FixA family protein [Bacteroidota bacterium]
MKILVCITHVPDTTSRIAFTNNNSEFDNSGVQFVIGPYDDYALARAVELKEQMGGSITVLNVGEAVTEPTLRKALAIGADDAIRINARADDSFFVASQIAEVAKTENYDLILMGRESIDFNGGMVHGMVGELLGIPSLSPVMKLEVENGVATLAREIEGGKEILEALLPLVVGCQEPIAEWKIPNMRGIMTARSKPLKVIEATTHSVATKTTSYDLPPEKGAIKMVDDMKELARLLKEEAKIL